MIKNILTNTDETNLLKKISYVSLHKISYVSHFVISVTLFNKFWLSL